MELNTSLTNTKNSLTTLTKIASASGISSSNKPTFMFSEPLTNFKSIYISYGEGIAERSVVKLPVSLIPQYLYLDFDGAQGTKFILNRPSAEVLKVHSYATNVTSWKEFGAIDIYGCNTY